MCYCKRYSQIKSYDNLYNYEKINDKHIICNLYDLGKYSNILIDDIKKHISTIDRIHFYCWYDGIKGGIVPDILKDKLWNNIPYTIHNIVYDDIEYTYDMAKKYIPDEYIISFIQEPNWLTYKKPVYDKWYDIVFPSIEYQHYLYNKYNIWSDIMNRGDNIKKLKLYIYPQSNYIPSLNFQKKNWIKIQTENSNNVCEYNNAYEQYTNELLYYNLRTTTPIISTY